MAMGSITRLGWVCNGEFWGIGVFEPSGPILQFGLGFSGVGWVESGAELEELLVGVDLSVVGWDDVLAGLYGPCSGSC